MIGLLLLVPTPPPVSDLLAFSVVEWRKTPEMRIEDAYKWLFHATLGGEHAVTDDSGPRRWMDREWAGLGKPFRFEPEVVPLRPDGKIVRINLRPYKVKGGDREMLLALFVESAKRFRSDKSDFVHEWIGLGQLLKRRAIGKVNRASWTKLDAALKPLGYPATHHSESYEKSYRPAYRVVLRELLAE
ncbi:MAG TPA: hypothetical protein VK934_10975 [Fimbriimonas sp.]|nr:hypothetical protein [Fimbriimonas sp.]